MNYFVLLNSTATRILGEPGFPVNIFSNLLGFILNFLYAFVSSITPVNALGFSIIILTFITRIFLVPLAIKSQHSSMKMQELTPEINKIKKKYGSATDPEQQKKMNQEMQTLYAKKGINPLSGCLPLLLQLPIFYALNQVMNHTYLYIKSINDLFVNKIANTIVSILETNNEVFKILIDVLEPIILPMTPTTTKTNLLSFFFRKPVLMDFGNPVQLAQALNKFTADNWQTLISSIPPSFTEQINQLNIFLAEKNVINTFFGLDLTKNPGFFSFPGIIIPVTAALTTFLSSYFMMKQSKNTMDPQAAATQKSMLYFMPLFMGYIVTVTPVGVGLYWITSNFFQVIQQIIINKIYSAKKENE